MQAWLWGIDGYVHWLTVSPGADPWFRFDGGGTALAYSGERFGIGEPIPSIRLKIQRNALQDLALLESFQNRRPVGGTACRGGAPFQRIPPARLVESRPALADRPPYEWTNGQIDEATSQRAACSQKTAADAWQNVHEFVLQLAGDVQVKSTAIALLPDDRPAARPGSFHP